MPEPELTDAVFEEYEKVRTSGACNMFLLSDVRTIAEVMGLDDLLVFCDSTEVYGQVLNGYGEWHARQK